MRKACCLVVFAILLGCAAAAAEASDLNIGAKFDLGKLPRDNRDANNTIIAFVPSLAYDCEYASMLTQSFYYYFDQGMAFELSKKKPTVNIFFVVHDEMNAAKSTQNIIGRMNVVHDPKGEIFAHYGVKLPEGKNQDSTVVLLDSKDNIVLIDNNYRAQGEHLKPLENKINRLNGIAVDLNRASAAKPLEVGDKAIDFLISKDKWLSHFRGNVILLSFYPAAFSGTFPKPTEALHPVTQAQTPQAPNPRSGENSYVKPGKIDIKGLTETKVLTDPVFATDRFKSDPRLNFNLNPASCYMQIRAIDLENAGSGRTVKRVVISSSTPTLLEKWEQALETENIIYANDPAYTISRQYLSYNPAGYNNRVSVIIDQKGRIFYIDDSFDAADEAVLNAKIKDLMSKK